MQLDLFRSLRGVIGPGARHGSLAGALPELVDAGYAGVLAPVGFAESIPDFRSQLGERGLDFIAIVMTDGASVAEHIQSLEQSLADAEFHRPRLVIAQSGRGAWSDSDATRFFEAAANVEDDVPYLVAHQTLRDRILCDPAVTDSMLGRFPDLRLAADFSHWVWACGRLLDDQPDVLRRCAARAVHINARIGDESGPQVADPDAPRWATQLAAHEQWWSMVWDEQERDGAVATTLMPEANSWEIASWLGERQRSRFAERTAGAGEGE